MIGFTVSSWQIVVARRARNDEAAQRIKAQASEKLAEAKAGELKTNLYFNRIALAHRESISEPANVKEAETLLDECPPGLRGWEWYYPKRRRLAAPILLRARGTQVAHCIAFSPDELLDPSEAG